MNDSNQKPEVKGQRSASDIYGSPAVPTNRITLVNPRFEFPSIAPYADVDFVHGVLGAAETGNTIQLMTLYRDIILSDAHIQGELAKRKLAVLGDSLNVRPFDKSKKDDVAAVDLVKQQIGDLSDWIRNCSHLLDSTVFPVSLLEKVYAPKAGGGFYIKELVPVPHRLQDYRYGELRIYDVDPQNGMPMASSHEADPNRYIVHRGHLLSTPDKFGGPMRSLVFWWLLGNMDRGWWARYLDKYGGPFMVGKYNSGDEDSRRVLESAFSYAVRIGGLVVTKDTEVEIKESASTSSAEGFEKFLAICQREISKLILGQTLSADNRGSGSMGSGGVAVLQGEVRDDIRQFDSLMLGTTLRDQLFKQFFTINNVAANVPALSWGTISPTAMAAFGTLLQNLKSAGLEITDEEIEATSTRLNISLRRNIAPAPAANPFETLSVLSVGNDDDPIARNAAADLARQFRGTHAEVARMVELSTSADDLERRIASRFSNLTPLRLSGLIEQALLAYAANGATAEVARQN